MGKKVYVKLSREEKRALLEKTSKKGRFFSVEFVKKDKSDRQAQCKEWDKSMLTYGLHDVRENPVKHLPQYFTAVDTGAWKWININLDTLKVLKADGKEYIFEETK